MGPAEEEPGDAPARIPYPNPGWSRLLSFALAVAFTLLSFTHTKVLILADSRLTLGLLGVLMWGSAGGFIHGVGFVPRKPLWRVLFSPFLSWPLLACGLLFIVSRA
jgi:cyd operon protein YbgE